MPIPERKMPKWQLIALVAGHIYPTLYTSTAAIGPNTKKAVDIARKIVEEAAK